MRKSIILSILLLLITSASLFAQSSLRQLLSSNRDYMQKETNPNCLLVLAELKPGEKSGGCVIIIGLESESYKYFLKDSQERIIISKQVEYDWQPIYEAEISETKAILYDANTGKVIQTLKASNILPKKEEKVPVKGKWERDYDSLENTTTFHTGFNRPIGWWVTRTSKHVVIRYHSSSCFVDLRDVVIYFTDDIEMKLVGSIDCDVDDNEYRPYSYLFMESINSSQLKAFQNKTIRGIKMGGVFNIVLTEEQAEEFRVFANDIPNLF